MEILRVENLTKIYGKGENEVRAVDGISFSVEKGEFLAIVGASGSGKSTLLHLLGGVDRPTSGKVFIDGKDIYTLNDAMERLKTLTNDLCRKMIQENQKGKLVSISLRDTNFHNIVRSVPLQTYTNAYVIVFEAASGLLEENFEEVGYRHIGVSMGSLKDANRILEQPSIFETPIQDTDSILAQLNKKLDHKDLFKASDLLKKGNEHE